MNIPLMMNSFAQDLRQGVRQLVRRPVFSLSAIGSLALGIGLTTTLFSVVNAVLLRRTVIERPEELVEIYSNLLELGFPQMTTSYPDYLAIKEGANALSDVAGHSFVRGILSGADRPALVVGESVTANYFDVLGIRPAMGRGFGADESVSPGAAPVVVLSHGLWQRAFGSRPDIVGTTLQLSGLAYTIVGVAPREFAGTVPGIRTDFWVPVMMVDELAFFGMQSTADRDPGATRLERRGTRWLFLKGRLASGRTVEQAREQVEAVFARVEREYPDLNKKIGATVLPASSIRFHPMVDGYVRIASIVLLTAVGLVLLIACANVANMLLAHGTARGRELAIRAAIGAGRGRIVRQLLTEGLILSAAGGVIGTLAAIWSGRLVSGFGTRVLPFPAHFDVTLDRTVLAFAMGVSLLTTLAFGLAPAWSASRIDLVPVLKDQTAGTLATGRRRFALGDSLVSAQLALSLVLLVCGALLVRGLIAARGTEMGFDPARIASLTFNLQMNGYDTDRAMAFRERAVEVLRGLPGVEAVSLATRLPLAPDVNMEGIKIPGRHAPDDPATPIDTVSIGADYFRAIGLPIVAGRAFTEDDVRGSRAVAIVNETMARQYWPDGSAVGRQIYPEGFDQPPREIVGVARDHKVRSVGEAPRSYLHLPAGPSRTVALVVRTSTPAAGALPMLRDALWRLEPNLVFTEEVSAAEIAATTMAPTRIGAGLIGAFAALALLLASIGLYGIIAYSVSLRTREVGIRMALGAARGQVIRLVLRQGSRLVLVGLTLGTLASLGAGRVLSSLLYGVSPVDPLAYAVAAGVLVGVAGVANLAPALAAARIDPLQALRRD
jgi:putative ABC transport system permease protein